MVTDLDGTLLNDLKEIDPSFWPTHQQLLQKGVLFSVASALDAAHRLGVRRLARFG